MIFQFLIGLMVVVFFMQESWGIANSGNEPLDYLLRTFNHGDLAHLLVNMYSLWNLRNLDKMVGIGELIVMMVVIWITSSLMLYGLHQLVPDIKATTVGFSGVILGLLLVNNYLVTGKLGKISGELILQILPHLFIAGISFWGHLMGLVGGLIYVMGRRMVQSN